MQPIDHAWTLLKKSWEGGYEGHDLFDYLNEQAGAMPEEEFAHEGFPRDGGDEQTVEDMNRLLELAAIQNLNPELTQISPNALTRARGYKHIRDLPEYGSSRWPIGDRDVKRRIFNSQGYQTD